MILSASDRLSINATSKTPLQLYSQNSKAFFKNTMEIFRLILIISRIRLEKILSTN